MNLNRDNIKKILFIITFTLVLAMCLFNLDKVFYYINILFAVATPFIIGGAMAFIVNIPMSGIEKTLFNNKMTGKNNKINGLKRFISLLLSFVFLIGIVVVVMGVVLPDLYKTLASVSVNITKFLPKAYEFVRNNVDSDIVEEYINKLQSLNWLEILNNYLNVFTSGAGNVISTTMDIFSSVMDTTVNIVIALVFCIYILVQKEELGRNCRKIIEAFLSKEHGESLLNFVDKTHSTFSNYVTGQCLDALILGTMFFAVLLITGMPYSLLIGVLIAFTALIPLVGAFIGCAISMFLLFMVNPMQSLIFLVIFIILQQIEENFIYPRVVGNSVDLPSIWVLVAVTVGGSLWGVIGMIIFIPLFSVIYYYFKQYVNRKRAEKTQDIVEE